MIRRKFLGAWEAAGREYRWDWDRLQLPSSALPSVEEAGREDEEEERAERREEAGRIELRQSTLVEGEKGGVTERRRPVEDRARVVL